MSGATARARQFLWFVAIWAVSVAVVGGIAELLHRWIMLGTRP